MEVTFLLHIEHDHFRTLCVEVAALVYWHAEHGAEAECTCS